MQENNLDTEILEAIRNYISETKQISLYEIMNTFSLSFMDASRYIAQLEEENLIDINSLQHKKSKISKTASVNSSNFKDKLYTFIGIISLVLIISFCISLYSCIRGCQKNTKEYEEQTRIQMEQIESQDKRETEEFLKSNRDFYIYQYSDTGDIFIPRATSILKEYAHDPSSVTDVLPISKVIKVRATAFPECRYALKVTYRAKNGFGALVKQQAIILFNKYGNGINIIETWPGVF